MPRFRVPLLVAVCVLITSWNILLHAQGRFRVGSLTAPPRITQSVNEDQLVQLSGQVQPLATPTNDQGSVPDSLPMPHLLLLLQRSPEQEAAFEHLINGMYSPGSPNYQQWLTAEEVGSQFGPAQADVSTVATWLESHGFQVNAIYPNGLAIDVSGTAGQIREAFHTEIHYYDVNGEQHKESLSTAQNAKSQYLARRRNVRSPCYFPVRFLRGGAHVVLYGT